LKKANVQVYSWVIKYYAKTILLCQKHFLEAICNSSTEICVCHT